MPDPGVLAVVYGGPSAEHEVSCISARRIVATALEGGFTVTVIGLTHDKQWVDADRVLADVDDVDALPSPDDLLRQDPGAGARPPRRRPAAGRRRVPRPARALRRGRRHPGPPRGDRRALRRRRRARLRHLHGQGHRQVGAARPRPPRRRVAAGGPLLLVRRRHGGGDRGARPAALRQARQPRLLHRRRQGVRRGGARGRRPVRLRVRRPRDPRGVRRRPRARARAAGQRRRAGHPGPARSSPAGSSTTTRTSTCSGSPRPSRPPT